jgi:DNA-directed RNA polymerase subunit beta'
METTAGQILINAALPEDMRDYSRVLDKKGVQALMTELAQKYPDKYAEINQKLHMLANEAVTLHGGPASLSLDSFRTPPQV